MHIETFLKICDTPHVSPDDIPAYSDDDITVNQREIIDRLNACPPKNKQTALQLLNVYLQSPAD